MEALKIYGNKNDEGNFQDSPINPMANIHYVKDDMTDEIKFVQFETPFSAWFLRTRPQYCNLRMTDVAGCRIGVCSVSH